MDTLLKKRTKEKISIECILASIYFLFLPMTVVRMPFGWSVLKCITIPLIGIFCIKIFLGRNEISFNFIHFAYSIYIIYTFSQLIYWNSDIAIQTTKDMFLGLLTLILISSKIYTKKETDLIETAWFLSGLFCIYIALTCHETVSLSESRTVIKIFGWEEDQNQFCAYFIMPMLISLKRIMNKSKISLLYIIFIGFSFYSILKTGSRGGLIGIVIGMGIYILIGVKDIKKKILLTILALLMAFCVTTIIFPMMPEDVRNRYSIEEIQEDKGSGRFDIWEYLIEYTCESPERIIKGSGLLSSYSILKNATKTFNNGVAHNSFIQIFNDQGIIGLLLFNFVILGCLLNNYKNEPIYTCAFISLMAFSVSLTFYVFKPYLNIMMMCAISQRGTLTEEKLKEK